MSGLPNGPDLVEKDLFPIFLNNPFPFLRKCFVDYGDIFTLQLGNFGITRHGATGKWVFLANEVYLKSLFKAKSSVILAGAANSILFQEIIPYDGSLMLDGPRHRDRRAILNDLVRSKKRVRSHTDAILKIVNQEIDQFPGNKIFELTPIFRRISGNIMKSITFGSIDNDEVNAISSNIAQFGNPALSHEQKRGLVGDCNFAIEKLIESCPHAMTKKEEGGDIYSVLMNAWKGDKILSEADVKAELLVIMLGGVDTTATSMAWVMAQILNDPVVLGMVLDEIKQVVGAGPLTSLKIDHLKYLEAVIYESCRISPALRNGSTRLLIDSLELGGPEGGGQIKLPQYTLPAGTIVASCMHLVHMREDYYPEPFKFKPERFLGVNPDPYRFIYFGGGNRRCLGMEFALYEIKSVIASLLHRCKFVPVAISVEPELQGSFFGPKGSIGVRMEAERAGLVR